MVTRSWIRNLFARAPSTVRKAPRHFRPAVEHLEHRLAPATLTEANATTLLITLDNANEALTIVSNGGTYSFGSSNNFVNGGVNNAADFTGFGTTALTMNASGLARYSTVRVEDSAARTSVAFNNSAANAYSDAFQVALDNGSAGVTFNGASSFGANALSVQTDRSITVNGGVSTSDGGITFEANQQATPTAGDFRGVAVFGTVTSTGAGNLVLRGRGGNDAATIFHVGVSVLFGGVVSSTGTGGITVVGTGGTGAGADYGVELFDAGSLITSVRGAIDITGTGGASTGGFAPGVLLHTGAKVTSTGTGATAATITITGTGAAGGGDRNDGIDVEEAGSEIATVDGDISLVATPGSNSSAVVIFDGGSISSTGAGDVELRAEAGDLFLDGPISALGATVRLTAEAGSVTQGLAGLITANTLALSAANGIDLDTAVTTITSASTTSAGNIRIDETDGVTLTSIVAANGSITINTGGDTIVTSVISTTDSDANDISVTATTGDITVGTISARTTAGDVTLVATGGTTGSIVDDDNQATRITGDVVTLNAALDIGRQLTVPQKDIDTTANTIIATTSNAPNASPPARGIWIDETNAVTLQNVTTADGLIRITTGGNTLATNVASAGTGRNTTIIASTGNITVNSVGSAAGNATLTATTGSILDDGSNAAGSLITANVVTLNAVSGAIGASGVNNEIDLQAVSLTATTATGNGNQFLGEADNVLVSSLTAGTGTITLVRGEFRLSASEVIANTSDLTVNSPSALDLRGFNETIDGFSGSGTVTSGVAGAVTLRVGQNNGDTGTFGGVIQNGSGTVAFFKAGTGTLTLAGASTYTGATTVNNGTLLVNGSITSNTTVNSGATLGGSGIITGDVTGAGTVAPGTGVGVLSIVGDFTPTGTVAFEVNSPYQAGTDVDQLVVTGSVDLSGATLNISGGTAVAAQGQVVTLIDNNSADSTTPASSPAGQATITLGSATFRIFYNVGDGNDVALIAPSAPTDITLNNNSVAENQPAGTMIGTFNSTDPDTGDTFTYMLVSGITAFAIDGNTLTTAAGIDFEAQSSYSIRVRSTDAFGLSVETDFTISVTDVDEAPTAVALSNSSVAENAGANAVVGDLSGTDPDDGDALTFSLPAGIGDNAAFNVSGTTLRANAGFDFEAKSSYAVTVRATDAGGLSFDQTFTINVTNVNEPPTVANSLAAVTVNEGSPAANTGTFADPEGNGTVTLIADLGTVTQDNTSGTWNWVYTPTDGPNGPITVTITATDTDGLTDTTTFSVAVNDVVPTIAISGAGSVNQSAIYTLTLGAVTDPGTDTVTQYIVNWGDGSSNTYTTGGDKTHVYSDGPATRAITVDLVDEDGTHTNRANPLSVTVNNLAPTAAVSGPSGGVRGQPRSFTFSAGNLSSADQAAGLVYTIDWGDGSPVQTIPRTAGNGSGVTLEHIYTASGRYSVTATATDKDDATSSPVMHTLSIVAIQMQGNDLVVGGTTGNDAIAITAGAKGTVKARVGGVLPGSFSPTGKIVIYGQAGNDNIQVANRVALPAWLYGDAGNDTLRGTNLADLLVGGAGNDVIHAGAGIDDVDGGDGNDLLLGAGGADLLAGGAGNDVIQAGAGEDWVDGSVGDDVINGGTGHDTLFGGSGHDRVNGGVGRDVALGGEGNDTLTGSLGRDLLIGGLGGDRLMGHDADDLLIAGPTAFDGNQGALDAIMAEWTSGRSYAARVANLNGTGSGPRANGEVFLKSSGPNVTVFDDGAVDVLSGASGSDWYFANLSGGVLDTVSSVSGIEIVDEL